MFHHIPVTLTVEIVLTAAAPNSDKNEKYYLIDTFLRPQAEPLRVRSPNSLAARIY